MTLDLFLSESPTMTMPDQRERLARMIQTDYRLTWRLLRRLGVPAIGVDDATQQVFLVAAERLGDIRTGSERSFLYGVALRVAQSARRRSTREPATDEADLGASSLPGPDELSDQRRDRELLDCILGEMPIDLRTVFILFELEGMTSPEISKIAEVPLGTVASRLRRARERFRELVTEKRPPIRSS